MNDLQRSVKSQNPPIRSRLSAQAGQKITIGLLAALIATVMIVWFSFLGWGFIAILQWLWDCIKTFSTTYF
jgi:Flp pilus assembly pilin Flp